MHIDREHGAGDWNISEPVSIAQLQSTVRAAAAGDQRAFAWLMGAYGSRVRAYARRMTEDDAAVEEITHDAFLALLRSADALRFESTLDTWLYRVVVNRCRDWLRRSRTLEVTVAGPELEVCADPAPGPEALTENTEAREHLAAAVQQLPAELREVVLLRFTAGLPYNHIAGILGCPPGSVASRLHRALVRLGEILNRQGFTRESL